MTDQILGETSGALSARDGEIPHPRVTISVEAIAYVALIVLTVTLRIADLDSIPMSVSEARPALAAWHSVRPDLGVPLSADSPLLFTLQTASYSLLGGTELAARIATALAGLLLVFSPLLFRRLLGRARTLYACLLLAFSPVLLLASRFSEPVVWTMLLVVLTLWAVWRYRATRRGVYASAAIVAFASAAFLTGPGSPLIALALAFAGAVSVGFTRAANRDSDEADTTLPLIRAVPWLQGAALAALVIVVVSTGFLLNQPGLSNVGALLDATLRGLTTSQPNMPAFAGLLNSVFYEPFLWLFGLVGVVVVVRRGMTPFDRFFVVWLVLSVLAELLFVGGAPAQALWMTLPLVALTMRAIEEILSDERRPLWDVPDWARWLLALSTFGLLGIFSLSFQTLARSLSRQNAVDGLPTIVSGLDPVASILVLMVVMFFIVGFFLAASVWNGRTALRGGALGLLLFGALTSLGSGWTAAVPEANSPLHPWHLTATGDEAPLLRATLMDVAKRETRGFPEMDVAVIAPRDGLVAWLLRDFTALHFYEDVALARGEGIVISSVPSAAVVAGMDARLNVPTPDLGGNYVGQHVLVTRTWSLDDLGPLNLLYWWTQRHTQRDVMREQVVDLWLRQDVYSGAPEAASQ